MKWIMKLSEFLEKYTDISANLYKLIIISIICILFFKILKSIFYNIYIRFNENPKNRYLYNRKSQVIFGILTIICLVIIWEKYLENVMTFISFFSAGVIIAIREIILNFFAGIYIRINRPFSLEDRIEVNEIKGDVVNMTATSFDILEIGERVNSEQSTGRIIHVPNSYVFSYPIKNYVKAFKYIWNEITVEVDLDSDISQIKELLYKIVRKNSIIKEIPKKMVTQIDDASADYRIYFNNLDPIIYTSIVEDHVELYIRYLVHPKKARNVENLIWIDILREYRNKRIPLYKK